MGLSIDNFAGGGGASEGIEQVMVLPVDVAINHDPDAIAMYKLNHPQTKHYCENVWDLKPYEVTKGEPVDLAWFSLDCKHFSKASCQIQKCRTAAIGLCDRKSELSFNKYAIGGKLIVEMLQHISFDPVPKGLFIPRVPERRIVQGDYLEDDTIERICFSVSIENCINAMPDGGYAVLGLNEMKKKGFTPILYSYNLFWNGENEVLTQKEVRKYVYDAEATNEYWLTTQKTINPVILEILNFEYSMEKAINGPILPVIRELDCDVFKGKIKDFRTFFKEEKQFNKYSNRDLLCYVGQCCHSREETKDAARK